jgi:hypothetical protein
VDALQLGVFRVAAPIGAGDGAQLEMADLAGMVHVRAAAQIDEIAGAVKADRGFAVLADHGLIARFLGDRRRALVAQQLEEFDFEVLAFAFMYSMASSALTSSRSKYFFFLRSSFMRFSILGKSSTVIGSSSAMS